MNCGEVKRLIQLYMDNELGARDTLDVQRHLEICSACSESLNALLEQDRLLKQTARKEVVNSSRVHENILAAIRDKSPKTGSRRLVLSLWKRVAAVAVLAIALALLLLRGGLLPGANDNIYAAVVSDHADHCSADIVAGAITDKGELARLSSDYGKMRAVPDLSAFGFADPRGRICKAGGVEFLHLVYYDREQLPVSLFMSPHSSQMIADQLSVVHKDSYSVASVSRSGIDLLVVTSLNGDQATAIAQTVAAGL